MISDLRIMREPLASASKTPAGSVDLYLGFDLLGAASDKNLVTAAPERTVAVVSTSAVPTGRMVVDTSERFPSSSTSSSDRIITRSEHNFYLDAVARLFGDHMMTTSSARRGLPADAAVLARGPRAGDRAERRGRGEEPGGFQLGPRGGRGGARRGRGGHAAAGAGRGGARAQRGRARPREAKRRTAPRQLRELVERRVPELVAFQDEGHGAALRRGCATGARPSRSAPPGTPSSPRRWRASSSS